MPHSLIWLPDVLKKAGLKVAPVNGWEDRGTLDKMGRSRDVGAIFGVICHHTAGVRRGNMPSLDTLKEGRPDLSGPLAQLGLGRDGTFYIIAAGRCNHAGNGIWKGLVNGNSNFIGIEAENTGGSNDFPWPVVQVEAYQRGVAAILTHIGRGAEFCAGHKEYALPKGRKNDPSFDMRAFRTGVAEIMQGTAPAPVLIPRVEPPNQPGGAVGQPPRRTLRRGDIDSLVKDVQVKLKMATTDGKFGPATEAALRAFQRDHNLVPDGIVGPKTWIALDAV